MGNQNEQKNPIAVLIASRKLTRYEFAIICNVDYTTVCNALQASSVRLSKKLMSGLTALGCDAAEVQRHYVEFCASKRKAVLASQSGKEGIA